MELKKHFKLFRQLTERKRKDVKGLLFRQRASITSRNWESISSFVVSLPNVSKKDVKGLLFRQRVAITSRNWESNSNFVVSLPNGGEKDVKGLLFRK